MFGSTTAVALAVAVEAELAAQQPARRRRARSVRRNGSSPLPTENGTGTGTERSEEGERLVRLLHDHIHQIAHLKNTPHLDALRSDVEAWLLPAGDGASGAPVTGDAAT